ncbi:hypothetical protein CKAN_00669000 [Cinnamomum micranthum f. kanehirae]|uniref:Uncharacterized protein n=1 Tax=Cinnamomum micranthum f. kanehirae TaxID=337451 RepID=A0A3S3Q2M9_9MAGN|nr:hypothetical protein CKAN_00669000 [Cinnamomum micranthum f. kanehirae]
MERPTMSYVVNELKESLALERVREQSLSLRWEETGTRSSSSIEMVPDGHMPSMTGPPPRIHGSFFQFRRIHRRIDRAKTLEMKLVAVEEAQQEDEGERAENRGMLSGSQEKDQMKEKDT